MSASARWSDELLAATGLDESQMPALVEGTRQAGTLRAELAAQLGHGGGVVDRRRRRRQCGVGLRHGHGRPGHAFVSLGTSGVLFAANDAYLPNPASAVHTFCHALPDTWHQMGVILSATDSLNWLSGITGKDAGELTAELGDDAARRRPA